MQGEISAGGLIIGGIIGQRGAPGNGIVSITLTGTSGLVDTYTILYTNGDTDTFEVTNGATGNGIVSITKTSSVGLVDTYTILYTNGSSDTIEVHNGEKGDKGDKGDTGLTPNLTIGSVTKGADASATITGTTDNPVLNLVLPKGDKGDKGDTGNTGATGVGIYSITKTGTADLVDTYTILYTNGDTQTYTITNGAKGDTGATGNGISTITKTGTAGLVDTYTITFTNGTTTTFDVTNGADGNVTDVQVEGVSVVDNGVANITGLATQNELDYYKTIYNVLPKVSGNGESITLDNTGESILKLDLKGNTSQTGTPTPSTPIPINVVSGDNTIKVEGKNLVEGKIEHNNINSSGLLLADNSFDMHIAKVVQGETYTITSNVINNGFVGGFFTSYPANNTSSYDNQRIVSNSYTFTAPITGYVAFRSLAGYEYAQLEKGSTSSQYEPYQSQTYPINLPVENLLDSSILEAGGISTSTGEDSTGNTRRTNGYIKVQPSQKYSFQYKTTSNNKQIVIYEYTSAKSFIKYTAIDNLTASLTLSSTTEYIRVRYSGDYSVQSSDIYNVQIELGNLNKYTPYGTTPIELCKIGDYQDYFYKDSGKWYLHKEIGKTTDTIGSNSKTISDMVSNASVYSYCGGSVSGTTITYTSALVVANTIYYPLATSTNTEITNNTLIGQLDNLEYAMSYEGQTNVSQVNNDKPFIISATALRSMLDYGNGE